MHKFIDVISNFGYSYNFSMSYSETQTIAHGKNYFSASIPQISCAITACTSLHSFSKIVSNTPLKISIAIISKYVAPIFSSIFLLLTGFYRTYVYNQTDDTLKFFTELLPDKINKFFKNNNYLINKIGEHAHNASAGLMILSSAVFIYTGSYKPALAMAFPIVYEALDSNNFVPYKIALIAEKIFPKINSLALILGGGILGLLTFIQEIYKILNFDFVNHISIKLDDIFKIYKTIPLKEWASPWNNNSNISFETCKEILTTKTSLNFVINPAHCKYSLTNTLNYNPNQNFDDLIKIFNDQDWESRAKFIKSDLMKDDRFKSNLLTSLKLHETPTNFEDNFDYYLILKFYGDPENKICLPDFKKDLTSKNGTIEKISFLKEKIKTPDLDLLVKQLIKSELENGISIFVKILKGECQRNGSAQDLKVLKNKVSEILLPYLENTTTIDKEDCLKKLAIEGSYCTLGVNETLDEIINGILFSNSDIENSKSLKYQQTVLIDLSTIRTSIFNEFYKTQTSYMGDQADDIHFFTSFKYSVANNILPCVKPKESDLFLIFSNLLTNFSLNFETHFYNKYKNELINYINTRMNYDHFDPLNELINQHPSFKKEQQDELKNLIDTKSENFTEIDSHNIKILYLSLLNIINPLIKNDLTNSQEIPALTHQS